MNNEVLEINYNIFLDLLEKSNVDENNIRTYKLIHKLITKKYIFESFTLMRTLYEEILYELAINADNNFKISIKIWPGTIRNKVIDNISILFDDVIDKKNVEDLYDYLSKMTHVNTIKVALKEMSKNNNLKKIMQLEALYFLIIIEHFYLSNIYKNQEIMELINCSLIVATINCSKTMSKMFEKLNMEEIKKYSGYIFDDKDQEYISRIREEINNDLKMLDMELNSNENKIYELAYELLNKYNYYKFYKEFVKKSNKMYK